MKETISDELLNAYIDNELDRKEQQFIRRAAMKDPQLQIKLTELKSLKQNIRASYESVKPKTAHIERKASLPLSMVASVALMTGLGAGWFASWCFESEQSDTLMGVQLQPVTQEQDKIILHVGSNDMEIYQRAIEKVGYFLQNEEFKRRGGQLEVIANSAGVEFLLAEESPYREDILELMKNDNVRFIACMNSLRRVLKEGREPELIKGVKVNGPAIEQIVGRMQQGWTYLKI